MHDPRPADDPANEAPTGGPGFPRWLKWSLLAALGVLVVGYGVIFLYAKVLNDSPAELTTDDLASALADPTIDPSTAPTTASTTASTVAPAAEPTVAPSTAATAAPVWNVTDASQLGYRVKEVLFGVDTEAVGRTNQITGTLTIDGTRVTQAQFTVDVASITSDESRRDGQFTGRIMSTAEFPTAVFTLTEPIELGTAPAEGVEVAATASGDLTLRGVTNPVTFEVTAQLANGRIGVFGNIPVVFADYRIANPSIAGITTEDHGLLEFVLVFEPA